VRDNNDSDDLPKTEVSVILRVEMAGRARRRSYRGLQNRIGKHISRGRRGRLPPTISRNEGELMLHKNLLLSLFLATVVLVGGVCSQTLKLTQTSKAQVSGLPKVASPYHIDGTDEVIGIISNNGQLFTLYGRDGVPRFSVKPWAELFINVEISPYDGLVLLADCAGGSLLWYTAYDYDGRKLFESGKLFGPIAASPTGKFYYTINDFVMGAGRPEVYDKDGRLLARYKPSSGFWEMKAIGDTMVLFQDGPRVRMINVPEMTVASEVEVTDMKPPIATLFTSLSPDGGHYAFSGRDKIAVCDLDENEVLFVEEPRLDDWPVCTDFLLAPSGEYLVQFWNRGKGVHRVQVWRRVNGGYVVTAQKTLPPFDVGVDLPVRAQVIAEEFCAINYFMYRPNLAFRAYLFDYRNAKGATIGGEVLKGYTSLVPHSDNEIRVLEVDADTSGSYTLHRFNVEVGDDK